MVTKRVNVLHCALDSLEYVLFWSVPAHCLVKIILFTEDSKKAENIFEEDDDILGMMESPPATSAKSNPEKQSNPIGGGSFLNSLMGADVSKHLEKPGAGVKREFVLDKKYQNKSGMSANIFNRLNI